MPKVNAKHLLDSKWTDLVPQARDKHFVVTQVHRTPSEHAPHGSAELRAVLSQQTRWVSIEELSDEALWKPGWI